MKYKYFECDVLFKGERVPQRRIICTDPKWSGCGESHPDDNQIFFYCNGLDMLFDLMRSEMEDFKVLSITNCFEEL